jgi:hypothetical protein
VLLDGFVVKNPPSSGSRWLLSVQIVTKIVWQQAMGFVVSFSEYFFSELWVPFFQGAGISQR